MPGLGKKNVTNIGVSLMMSGYERAGARILYTELFVSESGTWQQLGWLSTQGNVPVLALSPDLKRMWTITRE